MLDRVLAVTFMFAGIGAFIFGSLLTNFPMLGFGFTCLALGKTCLLQAEIEELRRKIDGR